MAQNARQGLLYVFIGVLGYAMLPIWTKNIQPSGLHPLDIATWRFTIAAPAIWLLLIATRTPAPSVPLPRRGLLSLGVILAGAALTVFFGLQYLPASTYILLFYSYPAMVALINFVLGERLPLQSWLALGLTLIGLTLTVPDFGAGLSADAWLGIAIALANALLVAVYFIRNNRLLRGRAGLRWASAWTITGALLAIWPVMLLGKGGLNVPPDLKTWGFLLGLALFSTIMPIFMFMNGIQRLGASRAAILSSIEPVFTVTLAAALLGETPAAVQLVGGALIILSVILLQVPLRRPVPAAPLPLGGD